jgi:tRNA threonylcarbamoyladenosine biosynthesis protein TsaE
MLIVRELCDLAATNALGEKLGGALRAGDVVGLSGELGSGKTTLARAIAAGAGVAPEEVSSPTFSLIHCYRGNAFPVHHADLYRLGSREELYATGYFDLLDGRGALLVEWIDRIASAAPQEWLELRLASGGRSASPEARRLEAIGHGARGAELARGLYR